MIDEHFAFPGIHVHVDPCIDRLPNSIFLIGCRAVDTLCFQVFYIAHVGDVKTLKTIFFFDDVRQNPAGCVHRNTVYVVMPRHDGQYSFIDRCFEWRQEIPAQHSFGDLGISVVYSAYGSASAQQMFHAGGHPLLRIIVVLQSLYGFTD